MPEYDQTSAIRYLTQDGNFSVPCSRYGRNSAECAEIAYEVYRITCNETGEDNGVDSLDHAMSLVVNNHDDVAYLLAAYGPEYGLVAEYLSDLLGENWQEYAVQS